MFDFISKKSLVGLKIESTSLALVQLARHKNKYRLLQVKSATLLPGIVQNGEVVKQEQFKIILNGLVKEMKIKGEDAAILLDQKFVYRKRFVLHSNEMKKIFHKINEEVMRDFPASNATWRIDYQALPHHNNEQIDIVLMAAQEKDVFQLYQSVSEVLKVKVIEMDLYALVRVFYHEPSLNPGEHQLIFYEYHYRGYLVLHDDVDIVCSRKFHFQQLNGLASELQQNLDLLLVGLSSAFRITKILVSSEHFQSNMSLNIFDKEILVTQLDLEDLFSVTHKTARTDLLPNLFACGVAMREKPKW